MVNDLTVRGWMLEEERLLLKRLAFGKTCLELGSYEGLSSISIASTGRHLTCIDTFDGRATPEPKDTLSVFMSNINAAGLIAKVRVLIGTTQEQMPLLVEEGRKYGFIFIDCDHSYEAVKHDLELAVKLLEPDGVIALHDYDTGHPGVEKAVKEFYQDGEGAYLVDQANSLVAFSLQKPEPKQSKPVIYTVMPHRDLQVHLGSAQALCFASYKYSRIYDDYGTSLLTQCFNQLYCNALNARKTDGVTHFAMLHNDVVPIKGWLDILMEEMELGGYDMISCVVPLKNSKGLTSTGVGTENPWHVRRLTMREVYQLPETFTYKDIDFRKGEEQLLLNTGCWLMRIDKPWAESLFFRQQDTIIWGLADLKFSPQSISEDWDFSRQLHTRGCKIAATRKVPLYHAREEFNNTEAWGEWDTDMAFHETERVVKDFTDKEAVAA